MAEAAVLQRLSSQIGTQGNQFRQAANDNTKFVQSFAKDIRRAFDAMQKANREILSSVEENSNNNARMASSIDNLTSMFGESLNVQSQALGELRAIKVGILGLADVMASSGGSTVGTIAETAAAGGALKKLALPALGALGLGGAAAYMASDDVTDGVVPKDSVTGQESGNGGGSVSELSSSGSGISGNATGNKLVEDLQKDFGLSKEQASGIVGNLHHESAGFTAMQEKNPVGGGRGGLGWAQWTGPRRKEFEKYTSENKLDPTSYEANYKFMTQSDAEKKEWEKALEAVRKQATVRGATMAFEQTYERAGVKAYGSRVRAGDQYFNTDTQAKPIETARNGGQPMIPGTGTIEDMKSIVSKDTTGERKQAAESIMDEQMGNEDVRAYCARLARSVLKKNGYDISGTNNLASSFDNVGSKIDPKDVKPGDVIVTNGGGMSGRHVAIVESVDLEKGTVTYIGGNQGRGDVTTRTQKIGDSMNFRRMDFVQQMHSKQEQQGVTSGTPGMEVTQKRPLNPQPAQTQVIEQNAVEKEAESAPQATPADSGSETENGPVRGDDVQGPTTGFSASDDKIYSSWADQLFNSKKPTATMVA